jgi:NADPH:quinone reductase-like Zn-dependent oxidoreductase
MRAARIESFGGFEMVQVADVPPPALGPGQVLLDVSGSSITPSISPFEAAGWRSSCP